ncbi:hypothetical protein RUM43_005532 [Polyplax serrata]|uniref:Multiple inositol polyphosphate phosphatase 1 n=1 Tax=Polyplax serrata TaxID=468196 RepID=A0AAN8S1J5_POLSC
MYRSHSFVLGLYISFVCILITPVTIGSDNSETGECFKVQDYFWKHLASKTPYRYVANRNDSQLVFDGCQPKKIWAIVRHGTRYPGSKFINKMRSRLVELQLSIVDNINEGKAKLCQSAAENITMWTPQMELADSKRLAHEGEEEMIELAERYQNRYPTLLGIDYTNSSFDFRCTATERTKQSKYYFLIGLFGRRVAHHVWAPEPIYKDPILRFYKLCSKWLKEVHKNPKAIRECEAFKQSQHLKDVLQSVSLRLGVKETLSYGKY